MPDQAMGPTAAAAVYTPVHGYQQQPQQHQQQRYHPHHEQQYQHQHYTPEGALRGIAADDSSLQETWQSYMNKVGFLGVPILLISSFGSWISLTNDCQYFPGRIPSPVLGRLINCACVLQHLLPIFNVKHHHIHSSNLSMSSASIISSTEHYHCI
jgi:hypothetical protein